MEPYAVNVARHANMKHTIHRAECKYLSSMNENLGEHDHRRRALKEVEARHPEWRLEFCVCDYCSQADNQLELAM